MPFFNICPVAAKIKPPQPSGVGEEEGSSGFRVQGSGFTCWMAMDSTSSSIRDKVRSLIALAKDVDGPTLLLMIKGSLPPVIYLAMFQSTPVALVLGDSAYIGAVVAGLAIACRPRGAFMQSVLLSTVLLLLAVPVTLLALFCAVKAREASVGTALVADISYNGPSAAVCAVFLLFMTYFINLMRAFYPKFNIEIVPFTIVATVMLTYGHVFPVFTTVLARSILKPMMLGIGLAVGVNLVVVPISSRVPFQILIQNHLMHSRQSLGLQILFWAETDSERRQQLGREISIAKITQAKILSALTLSRTEAMRELDYAHLTATDIDEIYLLAEAMTIPIVNLCSLPRILSEAAVLEKRDALLNLSESSTALIKACQDALAHAGLLLAPRKKKLFGPRVAGNTDYETSYPQDLDAILAKYRTERTRHADQLSRARSSNELSDELFLVLFVQSMIMRLAETVLSFVQAVDAKTMSRERHVSIPRFNHSHHIMLSATWRYLEATSSPSASKHPLSALARLIKSDESRFAARVAVATIIGTLPAFLAPSWQFYIAYRFVWLTITLLLGMDPVTSGGAISGLIYRGIATGLGAVAALLNYYIAGENTTAIIVLMVVFLSLHFWVLIKRRKLAAAVVTSYVTIILILAYELQVRKLGIDQSEGTGQPYLPINTLSLFRFIVTLAGVVLAFIFTIFPFPITAQRVLLRKTGIAFTALARNSALLRSDVMAKIYPATESKEAKEEGTQSPMPHQSLIDLTLPVGILHEEILELLLHTRFELSFKKKKKLDRRTYRDMIASMQR